MALPKIMAIQHSDECFKHFLQTVYDFLAIKAAIVRDPRSKWHRFEIKGIPALASLACT